MIIDRLAQFNKSQRIKVAVLAVVAVGWLSYHVITRGSAARLQAAKARYADIQYAYAETENNLGGLSELKKSLEGLQKEFEEQKQRWFTCEQAMQFVENMNTMALALNLRPISRTISEPKSILKDKNGNANPQDQLLATQSARVTVTGSYSDIIDFVNDLTLAERRQKVSIANIHIALAPGEKFHPRAAFDVVLLVDLSEEPKE